MKMFQKLTPSKVQFRGVSRSWIFNSLRTKYKVAVGFGLLLNSVWLLYIVHRWSASHYRINSLLTSQILITNLVFKRPAVYEVWPFKRRWKRGGGNIHFPKPMSHLPLQTGEPLSRCPSLHYNVTTYHIYSIGLRRGSEHACWAGEGLVQVLGLNTFKYLYLIKNTGCLYNYRFLLQNYFSPDLVLYYCLFKTKLRNCNL